MIAMGLNFEKGNFRYTIIESTDGHICLRKKGKEPNSICKNTSDLIDFYESRLNNIINIENPERIGIRLQSTQFATKEHLPFWFYPISIVYLIARQKQISVMEIDTNSLNRGDIGIPKTNSENNLSSISSLFKDQSPPWDNSQKYSALAGLYSLIDG